MPAASLALMASPRLPAALNDERPAAIALLLRGSTFGDVARPPEHEVGTEACEAERADRYPA